METKLEPNSVEYYVEYMRPILNKIKGKAKGEVIFQTDEILQQEFHRDLSYVLKSIMMEFNQKGLDEGYTEFTADPMLVKLYFMYDNKYIKIVSILNKISRKGMIRESGFWEYMKQLNEPFALFIKQNGQQIITGKLDS